MSHGRLCLVAVDSAKLHGFSIEIEILPGQPKLILISRSVLDAYLTEPDYCREYVKSLSRGVLKFSYEGITVGSLSGPGFGVWIVQDAGFFLGREFGDEGVLVRVQDILVEAVGQNTVIACLTGNLRIDPQGSH